MNLEDYNCKATMETIADMFIEIDKDIIYKDIARQIGKSESTIKWMKKNNPRMLETIRDGMILRRILKELDRVIS